MLCNLDAKLVNLYTNTTIKKNMMNTKLIASLTLASVLSGSAAFAGDFRTGVDNTIRIENGTTWERSTLNVDNYKKTVSDIEVTGTTDTNKFEVYAPNAIVTGSIDVNGNFTASAVGSTTPINLDPVIINLNSSYTENYSATSVEVNKVEGVIKSGSDGTYNETFIDAGSYGRL